MKLICDGLDLSDAVLKVSKALSVKASNPILEGIKITAKGDTLTLLATDMELTIEKKIKAEIFEEGETCVNGKFFSDFVNKISFTEVMIISDEKGILIRYGSSESYMQALPATDFPIFNGATIPEENYFETKQDDLKELVNKVVFCCATDESRPILKGCLLEAKNGKLYATALDGFRMACGYCDTATGAGDMKIVCPARTLVEISRMLENEGTVKIYADKHRLCVAVKDTVITSRLFVGEFVKKENIYPVEFDTKVIVKKSELVESVERASVLTRVDKNNLVLFDIKFGKIVITANSDIGKIEESVVGDLKGLELKIAMNGKFLLDALKVLTEEKVILSFNSSIQPFTVENIEDKRFEYLVLPVRTSNS